jgi:hypothetical protein
MSALDEILAMAREADLLVGQQHRYVKELMKFANLVIEAERDKGDLTIAYMAGHAKGVESGRKQAQQVAAPMTEAQIFACDPVPHVMFDQQRIDFARAIEAFHGITGAKT